MSPSSSSSNNMITLKSSDGETFEVEEVAAFLSMTIRCMVQEGQITQGAAISLPSVTANTFCRVIDYCNKQAEAGGSLTRPDKLALLSWDADFIKDADNPTIFDLIQAAYYLKIQGLLSLTCEAVAKMIRGMSLEEIRQFFEIQGSYTINAERQDEIRAQIESMGGYNSGTAKIASLILGI